MSHVRKGIYENLKISKVYGESPGYPFGRFTDAQITKRKPGIKGQTAKKRLRKKAQKELEKKPLRRNSYLIGELLEQLKGLKSLRKKDLE